MYPPCYQIVIEIPPKNQQIRSSIQLYKSYCENV